MKNTTGDVEFKLKFDYRNGNEIPFRANDILKVNKEKVIKINDGGTSSIDNISNSDIKYIKDMQW